MNVLSKSISIGAMVIIFIFGWLATQPSKQQEQPYPRWNGEEDEPIWW